MGFMDELKKIAKPYAEDDYDDDYDDMIKDDAPAADSGRSSAAPAYDLDDLGINDRSDRKGRRVSGGLGNKVVNINSETKMQVVLRQPTRFDEVSEIAEHLRDKHAVVLNLESTNKDSARRLVDFLSGCAYALDGQIKKVAVSTYIITPYNVDIIGDLVDELENNGIYL